MILSVTNLALILGIVGTILGIYGVWQITSLNRLRKNFFAGTKAVDLETVIETLKQELIDSRNREDVLEKSLLTLRHNSSFAVQKIGVTKFDPFGDGAGNFSFCLALLDEHNSGLVVTSMHGRQQNRIYSKKIENGTCAVKLTEEELQAVQDAEQKFQENFKK